MTRIAQSIDVNVPVRTAYNQWTQFEEFPRFMEGVREVRQLDTAHLHWRAERNGKEMEWDSEITDQVADHHIAWRDTSGPKNAGSISFQAVEPDRTRVQMTIDWNAADASSDAGQAAPAIAARVEQDLARFKKLLESRGAESGAWRGEIYDSQDVLADMSESADAADNPMQKTIGQTAAEREEAAQSGPEQAGDDRASALFDEHTTTAGHSDADRTQQHQSNGNTARNDERSFGAVPKSRSPQWLPNMLQRLEEPRVMVKKMSEEMDQLFERFIGRPMASRFGQVGGSGKWTPPVEIVQRDNQLVICTDLPGVKIEDVQIEIDEEKLTIEGERREQWHQAQVPGYRRSERCYGHFHRMIPLPAGANADAAQASMRDGVLEITMPMPASTERRGRRIDIQPPH